MAKRPDGYFALKLIAPSVEKKAMVVATSTIMELMPPHVPGKVPKISTASTPVGFIVGDDQTHISHGIAGHLVTTVLNFTHKEVAQCKSALEAEQLVKTKYKGWLVDAYDWFVLPGYFKGEAAAETKNAKSAKTQKLVAAKLQTARPAAKARSKK